MRPRSPGVNCRRWLPLWSEPKNAALERRLERLAEQPIGKQRESAAIDSRTQNVAALDHEQQRKHQQRHGDEKAERLIDAHRDRRDENHLDRMSEVAPFYRVE